MDYIEQMQQEARKLACLQDGFIVIDPDHTEYNIELSRCDSYEKIIWWISHLSEKTWITVPMIEQFILLACHEHKLRAAGPL
jgi:hypothetical protein